VEKFCYIFSVQPISCALDLGSWEAYVSAKANCTLLSSEFDLGGDIIRNDDESARLVPGKLGILLRILDAAGKAALAYFCINH